MQHTTETKKQKRTLVFLLYILLALIPLFAVATYTWFSLSKTPRVSDMALYINSSTGFELSWDMSDGSWGQHLNFSDENPDGTVLRPSTYNSAEDSFYAAAFGADGRISGISYKLNDLENANRSDGYGYYLKTTFYGRTGEKVGVSLSPAVTGNEKTEGAGTYLIGTPLWNSEQIIHNNGGNGAEDAVRVGFKLTKLDKDGNPLSEPSAFIIYEPNCDRHVDGSIDYIKTPSITGAETLVPEQNIIRQTASAWSETNPVLRSTVIYELGNFLDDTKLFSLTPDELIQIDMFIWFEGQDADCVNKIGDGASIFANIQFSAKAEDHSGIVPIE